MTIHLTIVIFLPLAGALVGALLPASRAQWGAFAGIVATAAYAAVMAFDFERGPDGLQYVTDDAWISELGIRWSLGVDGLNLWLIALTALLWVGAALYAWRAERYRDRVKPRVFWFWMALGETAVLGALCAQDLALFVFFFDLMLVPFYFLIGVWGEEDRIAATTKMVIYTLVGSLLMLAGAVALGVLATPEGGELSFALADLEQNTLGEGTQQWIFLLFAAAFLVKAPVFPLHGWMPDAYRAAPLPVLVVFSAVVSKIGVYGFLRIVLPVLPDASLHFQDVMLAFAVVSILYGSVVAFSQDDTRLVVGYSSIAQLGFILLGIFSMDPKGAEGAVMQMVNHGLVAAGLFFAIAALARRAGGSELLSRMGGIAFRAPALAALLLILAFANLAMPGTPNFVGELLILFGTFEDELVWGLVATAGVVLASVYTIRLFIRAMHNRQGEAVESRDACLLEIGVLAPLVAVVIALGVYPQVILDGIEPAVAEGTHREVSIISSAPPRDAPVGDPDAYERDELQVEDYEGPPE
ncbi:MAG TPA: NADH-quinone oxidoreductase subunit M [Thermoleophilaceae bacterium]|nr:NADH-quinone oxidoreductase subunit M [Thermoleophilaceae bacterium]